MKEVAWAVSKPGQAKLVIIAPNIQIPCPDSILLTQVRGLVAKCRDVGVPAIMGPSRKQLGMAFRTSGAMPATTVHHRTVLIIVALYILQRYLDFQQIHTQLRQLLQ